MARKSDIDQSNAFNLKWNGDTVGELIGLMAPAMAMKESTRFQSLYEDEMRVKQYCADNALDIITVPKIHTAIRRMRKIMNKHGGGTLASLATNEATYMGVLLGVNRAIILLPAYLGILDLTVV